MSYSLADMKIWAADHDGRCMSKEYHGMDHILSWMCSRGHTWDMLPSIVRQGGWCRQCLVKVRRKLVLQEMQQIANKRGGKCLSVEYIDSKHHLKWECKLGHQWLAQPVHVKNVKSWCPYCAGKAKHTIEQMQDLAKKRGGKCLSINYLNSKSKISWQCSKGHKWNAQPTKIIGGQWCPHLDCRYAKVSEKLRSDISELRSIAKARGGKLISTEYINRYTPLKWECAFGHRWIATTSKIMHGLTWCPICHPRRKQKSEYKIKLTQLQLRTWRQSSNTA